MQDYYEKYLKYKNKYITLKNQSGGLIELDKLTNDVLKNKVYPFPPGNYNIHIKLLADSGKNINKICHHFSLFSLYDISTNDCCGIESNYFKNLLKPVCNHGACNYKDSCLGGKICNALELLDCKVSCDKTKYKVRLYNFSTDEGIDNSFYPHSSRFENGLWWHKFMGYNCLFAIEEQPDFFKYKVAKEIEILSYPVPKEIFLNSEEKDLVFKATI